MNKNFMRGWGAALLSVFLLAVAAFFFGFQMIAKEPAPRSVAVQALSAPAEKQGGGRRVEFPRRGVPLVDPGSCQPRRRGERRVSHGGGGAQAV